MKTNNEMVMRWDDVSKYINPTIRKQFMSSAKPDEVDMKKYADAEQNVSAELRLYIPCFNKDSKGLARIWASIFNFTFIGDASEKNEQGFSQITTNYNKAMEFLQSDAAKNYCKQITDGELSALSFMRFGGSDIVRF